MDSKKLPVVVACCPTVLILIPVRVVYCFVVEPFQGVIAFGLGLCFGFAVTIIVKNILFKFILID